MFMYCGGGFGYFLFFTLTVREMIQFDEHIFQMGWFNHQLVVEYEPKGLLFLGQTELLIVYIYT